MRQCRLKQVSLSESGFQRKTKRTRKGELLDETNVAVLRSDVVALIAMHAPTPRAKGGRPPFPSETMLRIHFLKQWFSLSDSAIDETLCDVMLFSEFGGMDAGENNLPDGSAILRFRQLLETHNMTFRFWSPSTPR